MDSLNYRYELENLRSNLTTANSVVAELETKFDDLRIKYDTDCCKYEEKIQVLTERHERLVSSHQRLSKLNHDLEEKLLNIIEKSTTEIQQLTDELESTKSSLRKAQQTLNAITEERDRCKEDCISAVKLLQANPDKFLSELPRNESPSSDEVQVLTNLSNGDCSQGTSNPSFLNTDFFFSTFLPTFPPVGLFTGMHMENNLHLLHKNPSDNKHNHNIDSVHSSEAVKSAVKWRPSKSNSVIDL
ncbi:Brain-enriched guanylate kinase-associated protein [Schistosoma japonicum]|uniref:Brain-enriched guanylate kinase-associated protein n=1 Tax=Schistosoma japonicum TaxID=6182 RepID=C1LF04_SCHJA|nr:vertebrate brain-enriched guanylate kinase-associated protein [Schistosoma japonicum]KAH8862057.1 vertebrate brain-enriched guanylate kinase-associated protein [Schistosoma japonicum]KAH8862059.1 vertebrate brain-enriched guanylate kinase-associated protein [Schistosoma japonicum]TNN19237.1 Brain-enriched guanylate kinase-associated protein [Schistosoma japonicum]TNN19238.1 Brain-enriched guanylate kinase-associated protein [Schistosoma japonicum]